MLVVEARVGNDIPTSVLLRSETGAAPFTEVDWQPNIDDKPGPGWVAGDQVLVTGDWYGGDVSEGPRQEPQGLVVVVDGTTVHRHTLPDTQGVVGVGLFDDVFAVGMAVASSASVDE